VHSSAVKELKLSEDEALLKQELEDEFVALVRSSLTELVISLPASGHLPEIRTAFGIDSQQIIINELRAILKSIEDSEQPEEEIP
jgi:hypothetical protein